MKKIIIQTIFTITLFFTCIISSSAATNYIDLVNENIKTQVYLKKDEQVTYLNILPIKNYENNTYLYNITLNNFTKGYYDKYSYFWQLDLNEIDFKKISAIIYFGYGYLNRTEEKWYDITQYLIYEYLAGSNSEIYFVNETQEKINPYETEILELKNDLKNKYNMPSFISDSTEPIATLKINEKITLKDTNNLLSKMTIPNVYSSEISINNDELTASFSEPEIHSIPFTKEFRADKSSQIYKKGDIILLSRGHLDSYTKFLYFKILYPRLKISLKDEEGNIIKEKAQINIHYAPGEIYGTYDPNEGEIILDEIFKGDFFISELIAPYGYEKINNLNFTIASDDLELELVHKAITKNVNLKTINQSFLQITNQNTNKEYIIKTEANELTSIMLPYGDYLIKEANSKPEYNACETSLKINENYNENEIIYLKNSQITGSIKINFKDNMNNESLKENLKFKIKNLVTNTYLNNGEYFNTNDGELIINNIPYGDYLIEEINSHNYKSESQSYHFRISENKQLIEMNILNKLIEKESSNELLIDTDSANRTLISVPSTGNGENLLTVLLCSLILFLGIYICNYNEK